MQFLLIIDILSSYHPLPVVFSRAEGAHVWDPEGKEYIDMLSAYSSVLSTSSIRTIQLTLRSCFAAVL